MIQGNDNSKLEVIVTTPPSLLGASTAYRGISSLPPEMLSHIFIVGSRALDTLVFKDHRNNDDFATLCSHVCQYWRDVALNTSQLWCFLDFTRDPSEERCKVWIERSKNAPLAIHVFHPEGARELSRAHVILDLILPHGHRWKIFELVTKSYDALWFWQRELAPLRIAPILEYIRLSCYEDPPLLLGAHIPIPLLFPEGTPKIRSTNLSVVHLDWELTTFFTGLEHLHLAWHKAEVRMTVKQFMQVLRLCPKLETLILESSAPKPGDWTQERLLLPKLRCLTLVRITVSDAIPVIDHLDLPNLVDLTLDFEVDNVENFIHVVCQANRPCFGSIQTLVLFSFTCSATHGRWFLSTLHNVKSLSLDFRFIPLHFFESLISRSPLLCPRLETLRVSGLSDGLIKILIKARKRSPTPIRRLYVRREYFYQNDKCLKWLKRNVQLFELM